LVRWLTSQDGLEAITFNGLGQAVLPALTV